MHRNSQYRGNRQRGADDFDDRTRMQQGDERSGSYGNTGNYEDREDARFDPAGDRRRSSEEYYGPRGQGASRYGEDERRGRSGQRGYDYGEREYDNDYTRHGYEGGGYGRSERDNFSGSESGGRGNESDWSRGPSGSYGVGRGERSWQGGGSYGRGASFGQGSAFGQRERSDGSGAGYPSGQSRDFSASGYEPGYGGEEYGGGSRPGRSQGEWSHYGGSGGAGQQAQKRGPKGWQRSDERVKEDICERLYHNPSIDSSEVSVEVSGSKVSLEGTVPDRRMKHAIEDLIDQCPGVKDIDNRIRIQRPGESASSTAGGSTAAQGASPTSGSQGAGRERKE